jgi:hypothetical protein
MECPCMQNPGVRIEVEEDVVEPILDLIDSVMNKPSDSHSSMADTAAGRMFDYGHTKSDSREGRMTRSKLFRMGKMAQSFHDKLEDDDDLPQWVNDKVTTAEDRLRSAFEYMDYKLHRNKMQGKICNESTVRSMARNYLRSVL